MANGGARSGEMVGHVERLAADERLRIDTTAGRRLVAKLPREIKKTTDGLDVLYSEKVLGLIKKPAGLLRVVCAGKGAPVTLGELQKLLASQSNNHRVPMTLIVVAEPGFTIEAHELAERRAERTVILAEPNDAGGWNIMGPAEIKPLVDLIDPEPEESKRARVCAALDELRAELTAAGIKADRVMARTKLSPQTVEAEMKTWAKSQQGVTVRRIEGQVVLFDEKSAPAKEKTE